MDMPFGSLCYLQIVDSQSLKSLRIANWILFGVVIFFSLRTLGATLTIVPQFANTLSDLGSELTPVTQFLVNAHPWGYILAFVVLSGGLLTVQILDKSRFIALAANIVGMFVVWDALVFITVGMLQPLFKIISVLSGS
jgi:type II secretory pathway component PulF